MKGFLVVVVGLGGCLRPNPKACQDGTCTDPSIPYCDKEGMFGTPFTCIAVPDAGIHDAPDDAIVDTVLDAHLEVPLGPKLWLRFDDDPTDGVLDSASPTHTAVCNPSCPALVAGKKGNAYQFTADRIDVANTDLIPGAHFTISAWIRLDSSTTENSQGLCEQLNSSDCSYALVAALGNKPGWYGGSTQQTTGTTTLALGAWYHSLMIWDGTSRITYLNGTMVDSQPTQFGGSSTKLTIGARDFSSPLSFPGSIDEVLFYDRVLTASEIQLLAQP